MNGAYTNALQAKVTDAHGNPVSGITVVFELPGSGATGTFNGSAAVVTNANGVATAPTLFANTSAGTLTVNAFVTGVATPAGFSLTNVAGPVAGIVTAGGALESATVGKAFQALKAQVVDRFGNPVLTSGIAVTFIVTAGSNAASGSFASKKTTVTATTNVGGVATAPTLTANGTAGSFTVSATAAGASVPATFNLTNTAGAAADPAVSGPQSAVVNTVYAQAFTARVSDAFGNPVAGVIVVFTAPASGPSGTFDGQRTATAITNAEGVATAPSFTANGKAGRFVVTATTRGVAEPGRIVLTNLAESAAFPELTIASRKTAAL